MYTLSGVEQLATRVGSAFAFVGSVKNKETTRLALNRVYLALLSRVLHVTQVN